MQITKEQASLFFHYFKMFLHLVERLKPFALLTSLFFLSLLYTLNSFFANFENKVVKDFFHSKLIENDDAHVDINKQLSILRTGFKKTLEQYEASRRNFGKKFLDAVKNASFNKFPLVGKVSKQNTVCNNELFLLIQIHSRPENFMSRQAIRLSWGSMDHFIGNSQENNVTLR